MSWLSRLNPRSGRSAVASVAPSNPCTADPETCLMVFENHWRQVSWVLDQRETSSSSDDLTAVRNNTDQMLCLLAEERPAESTEGGSCVAPMGPILELVVTENILERLVQWHLRRGLDPDSQGALLKLFEMLIGQSQQPLLQHTAVLHPLLRLLGACADPELGCPPALENSLVLLLNQVCVSMARQPVVLEMLFQAAPAQQGSTNLLIFSLLVPFIHRDGAIGQQARDALLLVMAASASHEAVARYISENSYFCPVLATGLSALYSSLPRKIEVRGDDWHSLRREDWMGVSSLVLFMNSLEFCNAVVQVAHPLVRSQLLDYLHNGFLVPVMGPALHKSSVDEMIASTAYLDLFLRSVTETSLLKTFLRFILLHRHDNDTILDTLLTRISSNSRLCMVSLSLFRTLLSLHCEDIMLQLVLRYLLPCTHVMLSQRRAIRETDMYGKSANKFLSLIPECCRLNASSSTDRDDDNPFWGKVMNNPSTEAPAPPRPSTPSRLSFFMRQQSSGGGSGGGGSSNSPAVDPLHPGPSGSHALSPDSPMHQQQTHTECLEWDAGYLEYLKDARRGIEHCAWSCHDWSAPYDGENPSPSAAPPPPPTSNASLAMFPEHFSFQHGGSGGTPPGQQRAAVVAAARSEWSSSDRDSGEWDVTIGKNNCISLTPRSKKRTLQTEELLPKPVPPLVPSPSAASALSASHSTSSPSQHISTSTITVSYQPMYNGTIAQADGCSDSRDRGLEVKKVKRDLGEQQFLDENANQNGSPISYPSHSHAAVPQSLFSNRNSSDVKPLQFPAPDTKPLTNSGPHSISSDLPEANQQSQQSVERLIEELLEQAPDDPQQLPGDANGQGISIEAFTQELRELEDRVKERSQAASLQPDAAAESLSAEQQEDEQLSTALNAKLTGDVKGEASEVGVCSPARPLTQPASQPYTGPFMVVLFAKLENMLQNSLYVNILLTGIIAQLACYPQPLLRSFLLNTNMVFQPSVKSLIQVLGSVKNRIEAFAASHEDFPAMLRKAQQYLVARGKVDWTDMAAAVPPLRRSDSLDIENKVYHPFKMFVGTPLDSSSTSSVQANGSDPNSPDSESDGPSSSSPHHSLPCWVIQAQSDLAQAREELRQIQLRHATEIETVKRGVERAILGARREEKRLLERVEQDHRDAQQRLEQVERENMAAARVSQSLMEQRFEKLVQFQQQLQTVDHSVLSEKGPNKNLLLEEISEFLQPWEISVSLTKVNFKPSSQPNAVTFGDIRVEEQCLCLKVGGCGPNGKLCALHSQEMHCEDLNQQSSKRTKSTQGQGWTSPTGRMVKRINLLNHGDVESEEEQKLSSAKINHWLPKCEQFDWEASQVDEMDKSCFEQQGENVYLAVPSAKNKDIKAKDMVCTMSNAGKYYSPSNQRKMLSVATSRKASPSPERRQESAKMNRCLSLDSNGVDKGKRRLDSNNRPSHYASSTSTSPRMAPRDHLVSQSCLDITSKVRSHSRLSQSSDEHSLGTLGDSGRAPSPADSLDSTYTFIVSPSHDFSLNKGSLNHSFHLSKSAVDLTHKTRPLISSGANKQELCKDRSGNFSSVLSSTSASPPLSRGFDRGQILSYPNHVGHGILPQSKKSTTGLRQVPVARSLSMSVIDGSSQEHKRGREERGEPALVELEEEVDPLLMEFTASGVHLMGQFGRQGSGRADLTLPSGIHATPQGQLFIVDCGNARVQVTDPQGNVLQQVSSPNISGSSRRCRNYFDIAVNAKGLIALSCAAERALLVFSRHGRLLQTFGGSTLGSAKDELEAPRGVAVTRLDEFLVADIRKGTLIALKLDPKTGSRLERTVVTGFHRPYLVATCLSSGMVAVSERGNETGRVPCIKVLEPSWNTVRVLGVCAGMGPVLTCPWGICIDKDGNILVADWGEQHRIVLYPAQGVGWPIVRQGLSSPRGLTLLPDGQLAVSDSMHHCIKIYSYKG